MRIVIDVPEDYYNGIKSIPDRQCDANMLIIKNGVPLPKVHGRLIILSEDAVKREQTPLSFSCQNWISEVSLSNATVAIIEADKSAIEDAISEEAEEYEADLDN